MLGLEFGGECSLSRLRKIQRRARGYELIERDTHDREALVQISRLELGALQEASSFKIRSICDMVIF